MQDHAEEVDGCRADGLRGEEVVGLGRDAGADGGGLRGEDGGAVGDCVGEVLDDEPERGERGREGDGGAACGAADLRIGGFRPPGISYEVSLEPSEARCGCY